VRTQSIITAELTALQWFKIMYFEATRRILSASLEKIARARGLSRLQAITKGRRTPRDNERTVVRWRSTSDCLRRSLVPLGVRRLLFPRRAQRDSGNSALQTMPVLQHIIACCAAPEKRAAAIELQFLSPRPSSFPWRRNSTKRERYSGRSDRARTPPSRYTEMTSAVND
jgi:hypothetical protein